MRRTKTAQKVYWLPSLLKPRETRVYARFCVCVLHLYTRRRSKRAVEKEIQDLLQQVKESKEHAGQRPAS